jgi:hypothetical protein
LRFKLLFESADGDRDFFLILCLRFEVFGLPLLLADDDVEDELESLRFLLFVASESFRELFAFSLLFGIGSAAFELFSSPRTASFDFA